MTDETVVNFPGKAQEEALVGKVIVHIFATQFNHTYLLLVQEPGKKFTRKHFCHHDDVSSKIILLQDAAYECGFDFVVYDSSTEILIELSGANDNEE